MAGGKAKCRRGLAWDESSYKINDLGLNSMRNLLSTSSIVLRRCYSKSSSKRRFARLFWTTAFLSLSITARAGQLRNATEFMRVTSKCVSVRGDAPTDMNDKYAGMTFKTIFGHDGAVYAYTPGQSYGMKFIPGETIKYKIPLSRAVADAKSTLVVSGNKYIEANTVYYDHDGIKDRQISHGVTTYDIRNKTCLGRFTLDLDQSSSNISSWALHCDITSTECHIRDGIVGD
jgi:hypothetical protein